MSRRGATLIESQVALLILMVVLMGALSAYVAIFIGHDSVLAGNTAAATTRSPLDSMADHLRNAQAYDETSVRTAIAGVGSSYLAYYTDSAGGIVEYELKSGSLIQTVDGTATTLISNVSALQFTFWLGATASTYNANTLVQGDPATMTLADRARIAEIDIAMTAAVGGIARTFSTKVRLRNSPDKRRL